MSRHLKSRIISCLNSVVSRYVPNAEISTSHARGVRYFEPVELIKAYWGSMNTVQEGRHYQKHIIVRHYARNRAVLQLYTYHFPKTWSAACVANRELIKLAQRKAHALEHDYSPVGIEWRIRFFDHYFKVFKGGAKPAPGLKRYSRFYQFVYVSIYRELKAAVQQAAEKEAILRSNSRGYFPEPDPDDVTFDPIDHHPLRSRRTYPLRAVITPVPVFPPPPPSTYPLKFGTTVRT